MTDSGNKKMYYVTVCKDTSYTNQLGFWQDSLYVHAQSAEKARCELIVEANDDQVSSQKLFCTFKFCQLFDVSQQTNCLQVFRNVF